MGNVAISTAVVPSDFCWVDAATSWPQLVALLSGNIARSGLGVNVGPNFPAAIDTDKPWFRTNGDGTPDKWFIYSGGQWLSKHPDFVGKVVMYEGTDASIPLLDGGDGNPITPTTGAFWEVVTQLAARSPMGPGTLGVSGDTVNVTDQYGTDEHQLDVAQLPEHAHAIYGNATGTIGAGDGGWVIGTGPVVGGSEAIDLPAGNANKRTSRTDVEGNATVDALNLVHPVYGIWFIRRTSRLYSTP